jgi:tripartite-type tricarboxylate transporter receptor subunit TctC
VYLRFGSNFNAEEILMTKRPFIVASIAAVLGLATLPLTATAQAYPNKPVRLVIPFAPGGTTDIVGRIVADKLSMHLGQTVIVENRGGAGGAIGATEVAKAAPDGYTLGVATVSTMAVNPAANPKLQYNNLTDFIPITNMAAVPNVLVVSTAFPNFAPKDVKDLIALLKANPGKFSYGSSGTASIQHMIGELFQSATGTDLIHVPYKGAGPALIDLVGGTIPIMFDNLPSSMSHIRSGKLRPLAVAAPKRVDVLPDVPTFAELGLKDVNDQAWYGIIAPAKTPPDVLKKLHDALMKTLAMPDVKAKIAEQGATIVANTPAEFAVQIKDEFEKMKAIVTKKGIKLD